MPFQLETHLNVLANIIILKSFTKCASLDFTSHLHLGSYKLSPFRFSSQNKLTRSWENKVFFALQKVVSKFSEPRMSVRSCHLSDKTEEK